MVDNFRMIAADGRRRIGVVTNLLPGLLWVDGVLFVGEGFGDEAFSALGD